jgi:hypothetical protein
MDRVQQGKEGTFTAPPERLEEHGLICYEPYLFPSSMELSRCRRDILREIGAAKLGNALFTPGLPFPFRFF